MIFRNNYTLVPVLVTAIILLFFTKAAVADATKRPNIIFIMADDLGYADTGAYGATDIETPNIDKLANSGVRFSQFYAAAPVCSPSRAGLLTGRVPARAGVLANVSTSNPVSGLPLSEVTMAEVFKENGYRTALIGKWHLGSQPNEQGFDYSFGHLDGCIDNYSHFFYWQGANRHDLYRNGKEIFADGQYFPDIMVSEALEFIDRERDHPFFVYFAVNMPHYPYQGDNRWLRYYNDKKLMYPRNLYGAFVSTLDERIGRVLVGLESRKLEQNTIVVFQSDHGHSTEERAHFGGGSAGPYRGAKRSLFEGGIRVPAIIRWPGIIPANEKRDQMAVAIDWLPTLAELTGADVSNLALDGKSLANILNDADAPTAHSVMHWEFGEQWAVREGSWKLISNGLDTTQTSNPEKLRESDQLFLVNLDEDPSEGQNIAKQNPKRVRMMLEIHKEMSLVK